MRDPDVLDLAAREHRRLQRLLRRTLGGHGSAGPRHVDQDVIEQIASEVARHEAMDRLLLYPLVGRDAYGRRSLVDRRAEQRSISDQLAKAIRVGDDDDAVRTVLCGMQLTFVGHSDREEIEDFPHARRLSSRDERAGLAERRIRLGQELVDRLPAIRSTSVSSSASSDGSERLGPLQTAIVAAKEILAQLDRAKVGVGG